MFYKLYLSLDGFLMKWGDIHMDVEINALPKAQKIFVLNMIGRDD